MTVDGGPPITITIEADDTMDSLAARISNRLGIHGNADMVNNGTTEFLRIEANDGAEIEIFAGPGDLDALPGLGLQPTRLIGEPSNTDERELAEDSTFELGLIGEIGLLDSSSLEDAGVLLDSAMVQVRKAFRYITEGPPPDDPLADIIGPPPKFLANRIAAMEQALAQIQVVSPTGAILGLIV